MLGERNSNGRILDTNTPLAVGGDSTLALALAVEMLVCNNTKLLDGAEMTWYTKVADLLPEFKLMNPYASSRATVKDMFCECVASSR